MKVISKTFWKKLFKTSLWKQHSVEYPNIISLIKLVKLKLSIVHKSFSKVRLTFNIAIVQSSEAMAKGDL